MSFVYDEVPQGLSLAPSVTQTGGDVAGWTESYNAAQTLQIEAHNAGSLKTLWQKELFPLRQAVRERGNLQQPRNLSGVVSDEQMWRELSDNPSLYPEWADYNEDTAKGNVRDALDDLVQDHLTVKERETTGGWMGGFAGAAVGWFQDPTQLALSGALTVGAVMSAPIVAGSLGISNLTGIVLTEMVAGGAIEAGSQTVIKNWYDKLDMEYDYRQFYTAVAAGALFGAAIPLLPPVIRASLRTGKSAAQTVKGGLGRLTNADVRAGLDAFEEAGAIRKDKGTSARYVMDDQETVLDKPGSETTGRIDSHAPEPLEGAKLDGRTIESRQDLLNRLESGASNAEIDAHPAVVVASEEVNKRAQTVDTQGYGLVDWDSKRRFSFDDGTVEVGYASGVRRLYENAKKLAWVDDGMAAPANPITFGKRAFIVLGPPASGKSSIANPLARKHGAAIIDADEAKKALDEFNGGWGANAVHEESSDIAEIMLAAAMRENANIVIPKVGGSPGGIRVLIGNLKKKGYEVDLMAMQVETGEAQKRMLSRYINTGRFVNLDYLRSVGDQPTVTYNTLKEEGIADGFTLIDNNGKIDAPKPIIEDTRGILNGADLRLQRSGGTIGKADGIQERPGAHQPHPSVPKEELSHVARLNQATEDIFNGKLPEVEGKPNAETSRPIARDIPEEDPAIITKAIDDIPDDELLFIDGSDDSVIQISGSDIKAEIAQDQSMLDRLRGCVIK